MNKEEPFLYECPGCHTKIKVAEVVAEIPDEILRVELARRNGRRQTPHRGPGRPVVRRCPGCDQEMSSAELREHRVGCVHDRLQSLRGFTIRLEPKDPDPYPDFAINEVHAERVKFEKLSNEQQLEVELQKVAEITPSPQEHLARIRLYGHVTWDENSQIWRFVPSVLGRPALTGTLHLR